MHVNQLLIISAIWTVSGVSGVPIPQSSSADAENRAALLYGIGGGAAGLFVGLGLGGLLVDRNNRVEKHWAQRDAFYAKPELVQCLYEHLELPETAEAPILIDSDRWNDAGYKCREQGFTGAFECPSGLHRVIVLPTRAQLEEKERSRIVQEELDRLRPPPDEEDSTLQQFSLGKAPPADWFINKAKHVAENLGGLGRKVMPTTKSSLHTGPAWLPKMGGALPVPRLPALP